MAKVTSKKRLVEDEEPERHIAAEGKRIVKEMVAQQLDTSLTIEGQQKRERTFVSGAPLDGTPEPCGSVSLDAFHALQKRKELRSQLLGAGVSSKEADALLADDKRRISLPESRARQQIWKEVTEKLQQAERGTDDQSCSSRLEKELADCVPATGIYAQLAQAGRTELLRPFSKPIDLPAEDLLRTEEELFGHLRVEPAPPATSRKRRRARKIADSLRSQTDSQCDLPPPKLLPTGGVSEQAKQHRGSLWDIKEVVQQPSLPTASPNPCLSNVKSQATTTKRSKTIGCASQRLFTIKDGAIVELKEKEVRALANKTGDESSADVPDEALKRMTVAEIKAIPKFSSYEPGAPNKVLFVKNLPTRVSESELLSIFAEFCPAECRVMTGKMKGQAFVSFADEASAQRALDGVIGVMLEKKPVVVQFGRSQPSDKTGT